MFLIFLYAQETVSVSGFAMVCFVHKDKAYCAMANQVLEWILHPFVVILTVDAHRSGAAPDGGVGADTRH